MTDWLTRLPWGWYGMGLCLVVAFVYGAAYYMARQPPKGIDYALAGIDDDVNAPTLVGSTLDTSSEPDVDALVEEMFEGLWSWLCSRERETL